MKKPAIAWLLILSAVAEMAHAGLTGEGPALGPAAERLTQADIIAGQLSLADLRFAGMRIFTTSFNHYDGYGDGPMDPADTTSPGGRPTLGGNGTFLRINGLDAQSCNDCHGVVSSTSRPPRLGIGGAGGLNTAVMFMPRNIDVSDNAFNGHAAHDGRLIVPPALFGSGGLQLLAQEMTEDLAGLKSLALSQPGVPVELETKGVYFGQLTANETGALDTSQLEGIDADLVVRPFGRKGQFATVREFDQGAMMFHFGIQPAEVVGFGIDADGDGVTNEILAGELSALEVFVTTQDRPVQLKPGRDATLGQGRFRAAGCGDCHRSLLVTRGTQLHYRLTGDPQGGSYFSADLAAAPASFERQGDGLLVRLFGDMKRHDMGYDLGENFSGASDTVNREFMTAELWGVADTAPYLHDGRALTLNAAILAHGGEAQSARDAYAAFDDREKDQLLQFLHTLRSPAAPNADVLGGGDGDRIAGGRNGIQTVRPGAGRFPDRAGAQ